MKDKVIIGVVLLAAAAALSLYYWQHPLVAKVKIAGHTIPVELAVTRKEKEKGLGQRPTLAPGYGMLFVYDHRELYPFWMKDMHFPLDFIWIADKTVVDLTENIQPAYSQKLLPIIHPSVPVDKILEVNAGDIQRFGITIGDTVIFLDK